MISGQTKPTRVVRIIANDTVEQRVLQLQLHKSQEARMSSPLPGLSGRQQTEDGGTSLAVGGQSHPQSPVSAVLAASAGNEEDLVNDLDVGTLLRFFDEL